MAEPQLLFDLRAPTWERPTSPYSCGRDPVAGPGTCGAWWGGCPKAEKRGCFLLWAKSEPVVAYWLERAPIDWSPVPGGISNSTGYVLKSKGRIEVRQATDDAPALWRRKPA